MEILILVLSTIIYYSINYIVYYLTSKHKIPEFLNRKPYICYKCFNFWLNLFLGIILMIFVNWYFAMIILLDILDTLAIWLDEKNKTISINDFKKIENDGKLDK